MAEFFIDEPREIGKKRDRLSSRELSMIKDKAFESYNEMLNLPKYNNPKVNEI